MSDKGITRLDAFAAVAEKKIRELPDTFDNRRAKSILARMEFNEEPGEHPFSLEARYSSYDMAVVLRALFQTLDSLQDYAELLAGVVEKLEHPDKEG